MSEKKKERKTLYELQPEEFIIPGGVDLNGKKQPDLVAKRDHKSPGVMYRIELPPGFVKRRG